MVHELSKVGLMVQRQVEVPIYYDELFFEEGLRLDVLVNEKVIIEIKAVDVMNPVWDAQILSQLKMTNLPLG